MNRSPAKAFLALGLVFVSGVVLGGLGQRYFSLREVEASRPRRPSMEEMRRMYIQEMTDRLNLNSRQLEDLRVVLDQTDAKYREVRENRPVVLVPPRARPWCIRGASATRPAKRAGRSGAGRGRRAPVSLHADVSESAGPGWGAWPDQREIAVEPSNHLSGNLIPSKPWDRSAYAATSRGTVYSSHAAASLVSRWPPSNLTLTRLLTPASCMVMP